MYTILFYINSFFIGDGDGFIRNSFQTSMNQQNSTELTTKIQLIVYIKFRKKNEYIKQLEKKFLLNNNNMK